MLTWSLWLTVIFHLAIAKKTSTSMSPTHKTNTHKHTPPTTLKSNVPSTGTRATPSKKLCRYNSNLPLQDMYDHQAQPDYLYRDKSCWFQFLKLQKLNDSTVLLFGSIFNPTGTKKDPDFELLNKLLRLLKKKVIKYRLVIRWEHDPSSNDWTVKLDHTTYRPIKLVKDKSGKPIREYLIPAMLTSESKTIKPHHLTVQGNTPNISTSYVMVCLRFRDGTLDKKSNCIIAVSGTQVYCYCTTDKSGFVVLVAIFAILWIGYGLSLLYLLALGKKQEGPEIQLNLVLCQPMGATNEYLIIFRVGPTSEGFDDTCFIDLELLTKGDIPVGNIVRFRASKLRQPVAYSEMIMVVHSITTLGRIVGVSAVHSSSEGLLRLCDMKVIDVRNGNAIVQKAVFEQFIRNKPSTIRPISLSRANKNREQAQMPKSILCLNTAEKLTLGMLLLSVTSLLTMMAREHSSYDDSRLIILSLPVVVIFSFLIVVLTEMLCLYFIEKKSTAELHKLQQQFIREEQSSAVFDSTARIPGVITFLIIISSILFGIVTIIMSTEQDTGSAAQWLGLNMCALAFTVNAWLMADEFTAGYFSKQVDESLLFPSTIAECATTLNFSNQNGKTTDVSLPSISGPRLQNPKLMLQNLAEENKRRHCKESKRKISPKKKMKKMSCDSKQNLAAKDSSQTKAKDFQQAKLLLPKRKRSRGSRRTSECNLQNNK